MLQWSYTSFKSLCATPKKYQQCYNDLCKPIGECYNVRDNIQSISSLFNNDNKKLSKFVYKEILLFRIIWNYLNIL